MARRQKKRDLLEHHLSRRERQIMGAVYRLSGASVADIVANIPDPPTQDAVRRLCHILEDKGLLKSRADGQRKLYFPTVTFEDARRGALERVIDTFFGGSPGMLVAALLDSCRDQLNAEDIRRLTDIIRSSESEDERS